VIAGDCNETLESRVQVDRLKKSWWLAGKDTKRDISASVVLK
jgi:hypothetical protein